MLKQLLAFTVVFAVVAEPISAQLAQRPAPLRVRVSGAQEYEVAGVIRVSGGRFSGSSVVMDKTSARVVSPVDGSALVVLRPGKRLTGQILDVKDRIAVLLPDDDKASIRMPLESIGKVEVPKRNKLRTGLRTLRGAYVGVGVSTGVMWLSLGLANGCGSGGCLTLVLAAAAGAGITAGVLAGRGQDWGAVSPDWLVSQFARPGVDPLDPATSQSSRQDSGDPGGTRESTPSPTAAPATAPLILPRLEAVE